MNGKIMRTERKYGGGNERAGSRGLCARTAAAALSAVTAIAAIAAAAALSAALTSCEIGLGEAVDTRAPSVVIISPEARQTVGESFTVEGTASDNTGVARLTLSFAGKAEYKYEGGAWTRDGAPYQDATWTQDSGGNCAWAVTVSDVSGDGEYVITVSATDDMGNTSKNSVASRTVIYDSDPPQVTVSAPALSYDNFSEATTALGGVTTYKDYSALDGYINGSFTVAGNQKETFSLKYLQVLLSCYKGDNTPPFTVWKSPLYVAKSAYLDDLDGDVEDGVITEEDRASAVIDSALRSFSVTVPDLSKAENVIGGEENALPSGKSYLAVFTRSSDAAGNVEKQADENKIEQNLVLHGVFCYWPEADTPWIEFSMIGDAEKPYDSYPGTKLQGYSYDDDGIADVTATVMNIKTNVTSNYTLYEQDKNGGSTMCSWTIDAPTETGTYSVTVSARDIYGTEAETVKGYFTVRDVNSPSVKVSAPSQTETLFGDRNGNVTFTLSADDDSGVTKLACAYLKNESDAAFYLDPSYSGWDAVAPNIPSATDADGNLLWYIDPGASIGKTDGRVRYAAEFKVNIFSGLGIDGKSATLGGQHFIFYVQDDNGNPLALDYAVQGDTSVPSVAFGTMTVTHDGDKTEYDVNSLPTKGVPLVTGDTVTLTGTWGDDSMAVWQDASKLSAFSVKWNGAALDVTKTLGADGNGTWSATHTCASVSAVALSAEISDYAGNTGTAKASFTVDSITPSLESITSTNANGYYGSGDINVRMKFNKNITVSGGTPTLTLNNGGTATYKEGSGTLNLDFTYTIASGEDTTALDVLSFDYGGATLTDGSTAAAVSIAALNSNKANLASNKTIQIVTTAPEFVSAAVQSDGDGDVLSLNFSATVSKGSGSITLTQTDDTLKKVPAVLSESEYRIWSKSSAISLENYYTAGTNGADSAGSADLTTKYILNYDYNSDNSTLLSSYKAANLHIVTVNVKSGAVTADGTKLLVKLSGSYALPCRGAKYTVTVPKGIAVNVVDTSNEEATATVSYGGVETPVIRVNKGKWSFNSGSLTATQPMQSAVKIDCETAGAVIYYGESEKFFPYTDDTAKINLGTEKNEIYPEQGTSPGTPTPGTKYTAAFKIGDTTWDNGQKIFIAAEARKDGATSGTAYETAYRSVFVFDEANYNYAGGGEGEKRRDEFGSYARIWLRGGDAETGPVTTAGFPLSWDNSDAAGAALLTQDGAKWYYVTWELTTTAYVGVLMGIADNSSGTEGPAEWSYGKNAWVPFKKWYPIYPGESRYTNAEDYEWVWENQRGKFGFANTTTDRSGVTRTY